MEPIVAYLKRKLLASGAPSWDAIAAECGVAKSLPRKLAYGDRVNPRIQTVQPLVDYFHAQDLRVAAQSVAVRGNGTCPVVPAGAAEEVRHAA